MVCLPGLEAIGAVRGGAILLQDVPPYVMITGNPAKPFGVNAEGLKRRGFSEDGIAALRRAYKTLYRRSLGLAEAIEVLQAEQSAYAELGILVDFLRAAKRGIAR